MEISLYVADGTAYAYGKESFTEHLKDVKVWFQNPLTLEKHGEWNLSGGGLTYDAASGTVTLTIDKFTPDQPDQYAAGDVLCAQLTTDRRSQGYGEELTEMTYAPVSTGVSVFSQLDYEPETVDFTVNSFASLYHALEAGGRTFRPEHFRICGRAPGHLVHGRRGLGRRAGHCHRLRSGNLRTLRSPRPGAAGGDPVPVCEISRHGRQRGCGSLRLSRRGRCVRLGA